MRSLATLASGIVILGLSTAATAATTEYFVGAQLGHQSNAINFDYNATGLDPQLGGVTGANFGSEFNASGLAGSIFLGAKIYTSDSFFIAPEINFGTTDATSDLSVGLEDIAEISAEMEAGTSYGIGALLGVDILPEASIYSRLGYQYTVYELAISDGFDVISDRETFNGFRYGFGIETDLSSKTSIRLDWSQTSYSSEGYSESGETFSFEPTESLFKLGVSYKL